jgi:hypothetical protein
VGCFSLLTLLAACSTLETYPEQPERSDAEIAVLKGYNRFYFIYWEQADVSSVDGKRAGFPWSVSSVKLLPGRHWIEITQQRYFGGGGGYAVCAFESDFEAQHLYQLKAHSSASEGHWYENRPQPYKGSISIVVSAPGKARQTVTVTTECADGLPSFCRKDADCAHHPDNRCRSERGAVFGLCESGDS